MSQRPTVTGLLRGSMGEASSASASEKSTISSVLPSTSTATSKAAPKPLSCMICRGRKVRCDKLVPCSNCRRAQIACVYPSTNRPPRWARHFERVTNVAAVSTAAKVAPEAETGVDPVVERLRNLESLVEELRGQQANAEAAASIAGGASGVNFAISLPNRDFDSDHQMNTSSTATRSTGLQKQFGRLVLQDSSRSHYVSSGFWSCVDDEIDNLNMIIGGPPGGELDGSSEDDDSPGKLLFTQELERSPSERHAFLFQHNIGPSNPDLYEFRPLPSQISFLLNVYSKNIHSFINIVHLPTITKLMCDLHDNDMANITLASEALMFSIYYAAVTSMEEDDVVINFGCTKSELNIKFRLGLEYALAKADFLSAPDIILIQAFTIFLSLLNRHDSSKFIWMMTGIVIRMAQALGLHRDGSHFNHLTPYEVEIRRKVWGAVCLLDLRASEEQGTELTTTNSSFDTKIPLNINDADIDPQTTQTPIERQSLTDMTFTITSLEIFDIIKRMLALAGDSSEPNDKSRLLNEIHETLDRRYLQYKPKNEDISYWVAVTITRVIIAKMTLLTHLPVLFSSPNKHLTNEIRSKLLVSAIEVAEYNHALNSEKACRHWRWLFQTHTHWHAIVYLLIEICRRPWSPIVERAWVALHSSWLIPAQSKTNKDEDRRIWFPLRKLMSKAHKHRDVELNRLRGDAQAAAQLEAEDVLVPLPASSGPFSAGENDQTFLERWRKLVAMTTEVDHETQSRGKPVRSAGSPLIIARASHANPEQATDSAPKYGEGSLWGNSAYESAYSTHQDQANTNSTLGSARLAGLQGEVPGGQTWNSPHSALRSVQVGRQGDRSAGSGALPLSWADADPSMDVSGDPDLQMDLDAEVDWYNWVESAKGMSWNSG